jgi:hypothetical protein
MCMNDDILIPSPDVQTTADTDTTSLGGEDGSQGDQVFDISEDSISPIKEEEVAPTANQKFQLKKVVPRPYTPKVSPALKQEDLGTESPTKNVLDPQYVAPGIFATKSTPIAKPTPKIKLPPLPEIPAFKGTFDAKPHIFNPTVVKSPTLQQNFLNTTQLEGKVTPFNAPVTSTPPNSAVPLTSPTSTEIPVPSNQAGGPTLAQPLNSTVPGQGKPFVSAFGTPLAESPVTKNPTFTQTQPGISTGKIASTISPNTILPKMPAPTAASSIPRNPILATSSPFVRNPNTPANPATKTLGSQPRVQQPSKIQAPEKTDLKNLRTYESDVAEVLAHKQISKASIAIAANTQRRDGETEVAETGETSGEPTQNTSHNTLKFILILLSAFFIGAGLFGAYYLYSKSVFVPLKQPSTTQQQTSSAIISSDIVPVDSQTRVDIQGLTSAAIAQKIRIEIDKPQTQNTIRELVITNGNTQVSSSEMISRANLEMPDILQRSFTPLWTLGIYADEMGNKDVFVVATTQFFQNTFAGMLQWEKLMVDDLKPYLPVSARSTIPSPIETVTGTSTIATSTPQEPAETAYYFTIRGSFEDRITKNKDVRIFKTTQNNTLFLYSFINNKTLLVTGKESTLMAILDRLENQAFVR